MKITIREDGTLLVDGEWNTIVKIENKLDPNFKDRIFRHLEIDDGGRNLQHKITKFVFTSRVDEKEFGDEIFIEGIRYKFIGVDNRGETIIWNTDKSRVEVGYTKAEYDLKPKYKESNWKQLFRLK